MPSRSRLAILGALLLPVILVGAPAAIASPGAGVVDARNLSATPLQRVVVTWRHGPSAVPAAARRDHLAEAVPGIRHAAAVSDDAAAYWIPGAPAGAAALGKLHALAAVPGVAEVEPDVRVTADLTPNDVLYKTYQQDLFGAHGIDAEPAWDTSTGNGVTIAIVDTGYRPHSEFDPRIVQGYDFISDTRMANDGGGRDSDAHDPGDWITHAENLSGYFAGCPESHSSWHGTHVTGIAAARGNNVSGIAGIAWDADILPVRVLGKCGGWVSDIAAGVRWAAGGTVTGVPANQHPASVINMSLSGFGECESTMQAAIDAANSLGATVVAAAGNNTDDVMSYSPANCDGVVRVAATTSTGSRASFSNFGSGVTIAAPGVDIASTYNTGTTTPGTDAYALLSGTSMAAPHVTGVVALALAADPTLTPAAIRALLVGHVKTPASGCNCGAGIVDAGGVVAAAEAGPSPTPPPTPEPTPDPSLPPDVTAPSVIAFARAGVTPTGEASVPFDLVFSEGIRNLEPGDFAIGGTAHDCVVDAPTGSGSHYTVTARGCTEGTVSLTLHAGAVEDAFDNAGPAADVVSTAPAVLVDRTGPTVHQPAVVLRTGVSLTSSRLPVRVSWSATDPGGAGVASYEVLRTSDGGQSWVFVAAPTSPAISTSVPSSGTAAYVVGGVDAAGNPGDLAFGSTFRPVLVQESSGGISYHGTWKRVSSTSYSHGAARYATTAGASASYRFTGRAVGFVSRTGSGRGVVRIYLGSTKVATIDLGSASSTKRVVWARTFSSRVTKTLKIVVAGTSGGPRVDLDAIEVLR